MSFGRYLKDRWKTLVLLIFAVATGEIFLLIYPVHWVIRLYLGVSIPLLFLLGTYLEFRSKKEFYLETAEKMEKLREKYLIMEMLPETSCVEEVQLREILQDAGKSMAENVNVYKRIQEEYKEYIELWIHEIKLPIATSKMIIENNRSEVTRSIEEELTEIEQYVEQALYYARSSHANKDYFVAECKLKQIVNEAVKQNRQSLIRQKIRIEIDISDQTVFTDAKWCQFILNQIISNSMKYRKEEGAVIRFSAEERKEQTILGIWDNGIGIRPEEIGRVFEKGFTGSNGRSRKKSTGIGLYLCKKLCDKLGLGITLTSEEGNGCLVKLIFPKSSFSLTE